MSGITIGQSKTGDAITVPLNEPLRMAILGSSGSGKSVLLSNIVLLAARELRDKIQFIAFDPKLSSLVPLQSRLAVPPISDPTQFLPMMQKIEQLMLDRYITMKQRGITRIDPETMGSEFPMVVCIFEELLSITNNADLHPSSVKAIRDFFLTYCTRARACNMGFIFLSHTYSERDTIPVAARSQCHTRILMKAGINETKLLAEGMDEMCPAYQIAEPGIMYYANGDFNLWRKAKTFYCSDEQYKKIADAYSVDVRDLGLNWHVENGLVD